MTSAPVWVLASSFALILPACGGDEGAAGAADSGGAGRGAASDPGSTLTLSLHWDQDQDRDVFLPGACSDVGVSWMFWRLFNTDDRVLDAEGPCANVIDISGLSPDVYELVIEGVTETGNFVGGCNELRLGAEDATYDCNVER